MFKQFKHQLHLMAHHWFEQHAFSYSKKTEGMFSSHGWDKTTTHEMSAANRKVIAFLHNVSYKIIIHILFYQLTEAKVMTER